jgi:hypothetical protein
MRIDELRCSFCGAGNGEMRGKRGLKMVFVRQICAALNFAEIANIFFWRFGRSMGRRLRVRLAR